MYMYMYSTFLCLALLLMCQKNVIMYIVHVHSVYNPQTATTVLNIPKISPLLAYSVTR